MTSRKDQAQYWADPSKPYVFLPASEIAKEFKNSRFGRSLQSTLDVPYNKSMNHPAALSTKKYAVSKWELFKTCMARELLLISRHRFLYIFRTCQVCFSLSFSVLFNFVKQQITAKYFSINCFKYKGINHFLGKLLKIDKFSLVISLFFEPLELFSNINNLGST